MTTIRLDARGRRIPPPPARSFAPDAPNCTTGTPARPARLLTWKGDTRHTDGNISARIRRDGTPETTADYARLMAAPKGR